MLPNDPKSVWLEKMLHHTTTSYKLYWLLSVIREIERGGKCLTFRILALRMVVYSWYSLLEFHLNLGAVDQLSKLVNLLSQKYNLPSNMPPEELFDFLNDHLDGEDNKSLDLLCRMVPYRLLQPFFQQELCRKADQEKNEIVAHLSQRSAECMYSIDDRDRSICINEDWIQFVLRNSLLIEGWINFKMIEFLQSRNSSVPAISLKLKPPIQRDLTQARNLWSSLIIIQEYCDVYTNATLCEMNYSKYGMLCIDHFIPWTFTMHDKLWNLVPTFKSVNSSKNNALPNLRAFINRFCAVQHQAFNAICTIHPLRKYATDYVALHSSLFEAYEARAICEYEVFQNVLQQQILPLYQIASNQGYPLWDGYRVI